MRVKGSILLVFFCSFMCGLKAGKSNEYWSSPNEFAVLKSGKHWYIWRNDSMLPFNADFDSIFKPDVREKGNLIAEKIIRKSTVFRWKRLGADSVFIHYKKRHVTFLIFARGVNLIVRKNNLYGLLNRYGLVLNGYRFDEISPFYDFAMVKKNGKYGLLSMHGNTSEIKYTSIPYLRSNRHTFWVKGENGWGYLRFMGYPGYLEYDKELCPLIYDSITGFANNDLSIVMKDGKWGVMNDSGQLVVPLIYEWIAFVREYPNMHISDGEHPLSIGKFMVRETKGGRYYLINLKGEEIKDDDPAE